MQLPLNDEELFALSSRFHAATLLFCSFIYSLIVGVVKNVDGGSRVAIRGAE